MKILFVADIHVKLNTKNVPTEWAKNRYELLMDALWDLQDRCDVFIVGGDTFDKLPNMEELEIFFNFIASCKIPTYVYSGNHEAVKKNTTFLSSLKLVVKKINPLVEIIDDFYSVDNIDFIPYNKLKEPFPEFSGNILCTHVRGDIPPHVKAEVNLDIFNKWDVVLAGDLHSYENSQRNILYPGSPITTSFHRNTTKTGIIILDSVTLKHEWVELELPQLIRKTIKAGDPMPATEYHHTIYEIEGDMSQLSNVDDNDLIDKKIVKRETDVSLILNPELTLTEEVSEYLRYILLLNEETISKVLKELANYAK